MLPSIAWPIYTYRSFFNSVAGITMREEAEIHIFPRLEKGIYRQQFFSIGALYYTVFSECACKTLIYSCDPDGGNSK
jgi:hypothetical protein